MRNALRYWSLVVIVLVAVWAVRVITAPAPEQQCTQTYAAAQHESRSQCLDDLSAETVAYWTKVLGALTIVLATISAIEVLYLIQNAGMTREQIRLARRSMIEADRPIIFGYLRTPPIPLGTGIVSNEDGMKWLRDNGLTAVFENFGGKVGMIWRACFVIEARAVDDPISPPHPGANGGWLYPPGSISVPGRPFSERIDITEVMADNWIEIYIGKKTLWISGLVRYYDIFDEYYVDGFTVFFNSDSGTYQKWGGADYNYSRPEDKKAVPPARERPTPFEEARY
jgi:hypothetical protein